VLTRDQKLAERKDAGLVFLLATDDTRQQFDVVASHFGLQFTEDDFMSRCAKCNGLGFDEVSREMVRARGAVKPAIMEKIKQFWECRKCKHVYWQGPKYEEQHEKFVSIFLRGTADGATDATAAKRLQTPMLSELRSNKMSLERAEEGDGGGGGDGGGDGAAAAADKPSVGQQFGNWLSDRGR